MAINFPVPTIVSQEHLDSVSGITYIWVGTVGVTPVGFWQVKDGGGATAEPPPPSGGTSVSVGPTPPPSPGPNELWWNSSNGRLFINYTDIDTSQWVEASPGLSSPDAIPVGMILPHGSTTVPAGFLECNGNQVSRVTYADLFAEIGTKYGIGDGLLTFNLPDLRGEFIRGWDHGKFVDAVGTYSGTKTNANPTITGLSIPSNLIENGMKVTGTGIASNSLINNFTVLGNVVNTITLNFPISGNGAVEITILGRKFGSAQDDMLESHSHSNWALGSGNTVVPGTGSPIHNITSPQTGLTGGYETRPRNQTVMFVIKAFSVAVNPTLIDVSDLANDIISMQNNTFVSGPLSPLPVPAGAPLTVAHGLGVIPTKCSALMKCKSAAYGYDVGDLLPVQTDANGAYHYGIFFSVDAVNIKYRIALHGLHVMDLTSTDTYYQGGTTISDHFDLIFVAEK